jgi:SAM-dependent methyltransferase
MSPVTSRLTGIDERARLIPPEVLPFFDDDFVRGCDLLETYVGRLADGAFRRTGLEAACASPASIDEAIARAGLDAAVARVPAGWLLRLMAARGRLQVTTGSGEDPRYHAAESLPVEDPEEIEAAQRAVDRNALPSYRIAALAAEQYPAVLRGEVTGEQALFSADRMSVWVEYFSNDNPLYAISNRVAAEVAARALERMPGPILEIGGGLGSGALTLLAALEGRGRGTPLPAYRFTEISLPFLRRAQKSLMSRWPEAGIGFARLDMDRPFAEAGIEDGGFALVYGVNTLHVARDLAATLAAIRRALAPGGSLVIGECVRPFEGAPIYVEFGFQLLSAFRDAVLDSRWRPNGGFLTPEQWTAALVANGFTDVRMVPDVTAMRDAYPSSVIAAIAARRA